jgi:hypothetical protein
MQITNERAVLTFCNTTRRKNYQILESKKFGLSICSFFFPWTAIEKCGHFVGSIPLRKRLGKNNGEFICSCILRNVHQVFVTVNWEFIFGNFMEHILL